MAKIVPHFDFRIASAAAQEQGSRVNLEDAYLVADESSLFAVADGMGGHAAGEVAAQMAVEQAKNALEGRRSQKAIKAYVSQPGLENRRLLFSHLRRAFELANRAVREEAARNEATEGMGTTLDVAWLARDRAFIAHAGDGRAYLARSSAVIQLTQDHAQLERLKATGVVQPNKKSHSHNRLLNALGLQDEIAVDTLHVELARGDRLLLCSDGVHGAIESEARLSELMREGSPSGAAMALVTEAVRSGRDNATAVVIEVADRFVQRPAEDRGLAAEDLEAVSSTPLLQGLAQPQILAALSAAVEIELDEDDIVPRAVTNDLVAYIVLEGLVRFPGGKLVSVGALIFPESLVGVSAWGEPPWVEEHARLLRLRGDDYREVCAADPELGSELYRCLAEHMARSAVRHQSTRRPKPKSMPKIPAAAASTRTSKKST